MNKSSHQVKFLGSVVLLLSVAGVLLAVGGQLNFIGQERPQTAKTAVQPASSGSGKQPKYSFYEDLKNRKTELDKTEKQHSIAQKSLTENTSQDSGTTLYWVQIGAFSKEKDASKIKNQAEMLGFAARVAKGGSKYLAQAGPFSGKKAASIAQKQLRKAKFPTLIKRVK